MKQPPKQDKLTTILIVLWAAAFALGVLTIFVVFFPTGYGTISVKGNSASSGSASTSTIPTSTATSTATSTNATNTPGLFSSEYAFPYPAAWTEGNEQFSITGASYANGQITISLAIKMGSSPDCVPVNVRLVADESGTLKPPSSPAGPNFTFPDTQSCNGTPGATYSQSLLFSVDPSTVAPFLMTSGGTSNVFFNVATSSSGGVDIALPSHSG